MSDQRPPGSGQGRAGGGPRMPANQADQQQQQAQPEGNNPPANLNAVPPPDQPIVPEVGPNQQTPPGRASGPPHTPANEPDQADQAQPEGHNPPANLNAVPLPGQLLVGGVGPNPQRAPERLRRPQMPPNQTQDGQPEGHIPPANLNPVPLPGQLIRGGVGSNQQRPPETLRKPHLPIVLIHKEVHSVYTGQVPTCRTYWQNTILQTKRVLWSRKPVTRSRNKGLWPKIQLHFQDTSAGTNVCASYLPPRTSKEQLYCSWLFRNGWSESRAEQIVPKTVRLSPLCRRQ